jgi:hypothetical protein
VRRALWVMADTCLICAVASAFGVFATQVWTGFHVPLRWLALPIAFFGLALTFGLAHDKFQRPDS